MEQIWAPWRIEYILKADEGGCFLCQKPRESNDKLNFILCRGKSNFMILNSFPYNPGHLMIVPNRHITEYTELTKSEVIHISRTIQGLQNLLNRLYNPKGYNIGMNQGRIAGGSIEHLHFHLVLVIELLYDHFSLVKI